MSRLNGDLTNMAERVHDAEQKQAFAEKEVEAMKAHESALNEKVRSLEVAMLNVYQV